MELLEVLRAGGGIDVIREVVAFVLQALLDAEASALMGAERYEWTEEGTT